MVPQAVCVGGMLCVPHTATPTPTPTTGPCAGDCNGDAAVTVDELVTGVLIAVGNTPLAACSDLDINKDGSATVNEILVAANNTLNGCP